ncbi:L,D-transpeptidase family protein [Donghicola mangrovi]|uniref:L,D-transpeptidase family protein n=1 Tax=Donghicola mangrovi TaxID=2729614 RepID=A0A850Q1F1_9RHOB|nr:L,D-transpeptidase family protein [Donghicola mangrovi]NVO22916.1 L,D-transpeptidase family protein [Donghicola mangrovi]
MLAQLARKMVRLQLVFAVLALVFAGFGAPAHAQSAAIKQAIAEASANDEDIAAYYRDNGFDPIWIGRGKNARRLEALFEALEQSGSHGLPTSSYKIDQLKAEISAAKTARQVGNIEVALSEIFLRYATNLQTGVLVPRRIDPLIVREVPYRARKSYLESLVKSTPRPFFRALAPQTQEYNRLFAVKADLELAVGRGDWGQKVPGALKPGAGGNSVAILRNRLQAMGYLGRTATTTYDASIQQAVQVFQMDHGLTADGVAGPATIDEINKQAADRLASVIVAMERERWLNKERGARHVLVNITDFTAKIIDNDKVTFETRSVVGANSDDRRTPEFSDVMEMVVVNPSWNVPRSITVKEYLPMLKANPNAVGHLKLVDNRGRVVARNGVNFAQYDAKTFPFSLKEPPSDGNALGQVKFLFPNPYNIYLHDTPAKNLFGREVRAYSHGCIRLGQPFDFAYALLAAQEADPQGYFQSVLKTGRETTISLKQPIPVHLIYRTAFTSSKGHVQYRRDVYGRDAKIWNALAQRGVVLRGIQG